VNIGSYDHGIPVTLIAFAIALHNLVWGFSQPFAGAAADRYGFKPLPSEALTRFMTKNIINVNIAKTGVSTRHPVGFF
jgi:hypothetical protein